jgi:hypothetical protein
MYVEENKKILEELGIPLEQDVQRLTRADFNSRFKAIRAAKIVSDYDTMIIPSSES